MKKLAVLVVGLTLLGACEKPQESVTRVVPQPPPEAAQTADESTPVETEVMGAATESVVDVEQAGAAVATGIVEAAETAVADVGAVAEDVVADAEEAVDDVVPAEAAPARPEGVSDATMIITVSQATNLVNADIYTYGWGSKEKPLFMSEGETQWAISFAVDVPAGQYELAVDQATRGQERPFDVAINDSVVMSDVGAECVTKGGSSVSTEVFPIGTVELAEGANIITLSQDGNESPHIAAVLVTPVE